MQDYIVHKLKQYYGIDICNLNKIHMGHNECFSGNDNLCSYFVKLFPITEITGVSNEVKYIGYLSGKFCVPQIIYTKKMPHLLKIKKTRKLFLSKNM